MAPQAHAQAPNDLRRQLEETKETLREKQAQEANLATDLRQLEVEREQLSQNLIDTARRIQESEGELSTIEDRLGELEAQERLLRGSLAKQHGSIAQLLGAMQRMGRDPPPVMITRREDALVMVRSAMMLAAAFPQLKDKAVALAMQIDDLARVMGESRSQREKLRAETQTMNEARTRLSGLIEIKRRSLQERQDELGRLRRETEAIGRRSKDLDDLVRDIEKRAMEVPAIAAAPLPPPPPSNVPPGAIASAPAPAAVRPALDQPARSGPQAPTEVAMNLPRPGAMDSGVDVVMLPKGQVPSTQNQSRIKPAIPFHQAMGRLPLPVRGKRLTAFGEKGPFNQSSGIVIATRPGAQVVSPVDGEIVYAGVFRSYGQILIISGGQGYLMLLAGLQQIDVQLGQSVLAGEPVGLMGGPPRGMKLTEPASPPVLYIELRKDNRPIDPDPWWAK
jgi:septal ring factor EnvC (AmiA/AmiB activator)